jgi:very-short-patch-repair endonuclease
MATRRNRQVKGASFGASTRLCPYVADFFCFAVRLVIELDGNHLGDERERQADEQRTNTSKIAAIACCVSGMKRCWTILMAVLETISNFLLSLTRAAAAARPLPPGRGHTVAAII